jgi:hypothetical protein
MSWAAQELAGVELGDERLNRRSHKVLEQLGDKPTHRTPTACGGWAETLAAYRLFSNAKVSPNKILAPHRKSTLERMAEHELVLCVADSTEFDHTEQQRTMRGLGPLNYSMRRGQLGHFLLAVTPERVPLGVLAADLWVRHDEHFGERDLRQKKPLEEKESARWVSMVGRCRELAGKLARTRLVYVADREADIHELLLEVTSGEIDGVIRVQNDRAQPAEALSIRTEVAAGEPQGAIDFDIPATEKRQARHVHASVRSARVTLRGPRRPGGGCLPDIPITVVHVAEEGGPEGEEPIEWFLYTTLGADTLEQSVRVIEIYRCRWMIEVFFRVLKTGCKVEEMQFHHIDRVRAALGFYLIIAWRVLYMTMIGRASPELPCDVIFDTEEWHAIYIVTQRKPPPEQPLPLDQVVRMMATFGGFLNRKADGFPGPQSIWVGLQRTRDFVLALQAQKDAARCV